MVLPSAVAGQLFQWTADNKLLLQKQVHSGTELVLFDIRNNQSQSIYQGEVLWAQKQDNALYLMEQQHRIQKLNGDHVTEMAALRDIVASNRFFIKNEQLFLLDREDNFWQLNLATNKRTKLTHHSNPTISLTEVSEDGRRFLISKQISNKKEIVLLTP